MPGGEEGGGGWPLWVTGQGPGQDRSSNMHSAASPEDLHKLFVHMLNSGDIDALADLYAVDGFLMALEE